MELLMKGIDISHWQGNFNWSQAVKEGIEFAIIKGGGGDSNVYYRDNKFDLNYERAKAQKLPVGVYWYSRALTVEQAEKEADYFYNNILKGKQFELPVYIDVEENAMLSLGKRALTDVIHTWCQRIEQYGYWVGIYSSLSYFKSYMLDNELARYAHWVAQWSTVCTYPNQDCLGVWQYSSSEVVAGVRCDTDYLIQDYTQQIPALGLNGFPKIGDINEDGKVNAQDLTRLMKDIANDNTNAKEDINKDGVVNTKDLTKLSKIIAGE